MCSTTTTTTHYLISSSGITKKGQAGVSLNPIWPSSRRPKILFQFLWRGNQRALRTATATRGQKPPQGTKIQPFPVSKRFNKLPQRTPALVWPTVPLRIDICILPESIFRMNTNTDLWFICWQCQCYWTMNEFWEIIYAHRLYYR